MTNTAIKITKEQDEKAWLETRKKGVGGTDVATILGLNPYKTPLELWEEKTGRTEPTPAGEAAYWGCQLEDMVAKEFQKRTGMKVQKVNSMMTAGENGWMRGNLDRAVINPEIAQRVIVLKPAKAAEAGRLLSTDIGLECKTCSAYKASQWGPSQEDEIKAGNVTSEHTVPLYYETQIQWYMAITGIKVFYLAVLIGGQDFRIYEIKRNDEVIEAIKDKCQYFWMNNVLADAPPAPINAEDVKRLYEKDNGEMVEADNFCAADVGELRTIKEQIKSLKEDEERIVDRLTAYIGEASGLTIGGEKVLTYKAQGSRRLNTVQLKKIHPDIYESFSSVSTTRVLRLH